MWIFLIIILVALLFLEVGLIMLRFLIRGRRVYNNPSDSPQETEPQSVSNPPNVVPRAVPFARQANTQGGSWYGVAADALRSRRLGQITDTDLSAVLQRVLPARG